MVLTMQLQLLRPMVEGYHGALMSDRSIELAKHWNALIPKR